MKRIVLAATVALFTAATLAPAYAKITQTNGGGNQPSGNANGVPSTNPAGQEPPGQNKKQTGNPN